VSRRPGRNPETRVPGREIRIGQLDAVAINARKTNLERGTVIAKLTLLPPVFISSRNKS
jgi:hypothetical protein